VGAGHQEQHVSPGQPTPPDQPDRQERRATQASPGRPAPRDRRDRQEQRVARASLGRPAPRDRRGQRAPPDRRATGSQGLLGQPDYGYVYNLAAQTAAVEGAVLFDTNGPLSDFTHTARSASITVVSAGTYLVDFSISGTEPNQFSLFDNASAVAGTTYGSGAGTQQNVLTLVNHSSAAAIGLASDIGGTQANDNASLVIEELG
jgi:hypothetical protein